MVRVCLWVFFLSHYTIIMIIVINLFHEQTPKGTLGLCCILTLPNQWLYHSSMDRYCCNILQGYMHGIFNFTRMKNSLIKACVHYFSFFFHQMRALMFFWKMFFVSSKKLFLFLKYWIFCISVVPLFSLSAIVLEDDQR